MILKRLILILLVLNVCFADFESFFENKGVNLTSFKNPFFDEISGDNTLKLQAIFDKKAKINDKWYQKDEFIDNAKILQISPNSVLLQKDGQRIRLKISDKNPKIKIKSIKAKFE